MRRAPPWPYPRVLAHRGGGKLAPENTLAAIRVGRRYGYRGIEVDAMLAGDEVPVLMHDPTLSRTTSGRGAVADFDAAQLAALDGGAWHSPQFAGEPVPTLAAAVAECRAHGTWINIEIKPAPGTAARTGEVVARETARLYADLLRPGGDRAEGVDARVPLLSSFEPEALAAARAAAPDIPRGYLLHFVRRDWERVLANLGCVALHVNHRQLNPELARAVKAAGYWLFCYTVNDATRARELFGWGVDALCTDRIDLLPPGLEAPSGAQR